MSIRSTSSTEAIGSASSVSSSLGGRGAVGADVAQFGLAVAFDDFLDADPTGDDRQVGRQRTLPLEPSQDGVLVVDDPQQDLGGDVLDIGRREDQRPGMLDVADDVVDQAHVAVDEVVPGPRLVSQAAVDE